MNPRLVLHVCCAPDEAWAAKTLKPLYDLHCFFSNSNIFPREEYDLRISQARMVAEHFGLAFDSDGYRPESWEESIRRLDHTPEGGARCFECFLLRLRSTAKFCADRGFPSFTTVMSISPHKSIRMLNETGLRAAAEFGVRYEPFDFKKKNGFLGSIALSRDLGLYRQNYCGCRLSRDEREQHRTDSHHSPVHP